MRKIKVFTLILIAGWLQWSCCDMEENNANADKKPVPAVAQENFDTKLTQKEKSDGILTPEVLWKFGRVGDPQLSEDGKLVFYTVTHYDAKTNNRRTNIFSVNTENKKIKQLTDNTNAKYNQRIKPGKDVIGYISTASGSTQIYEMDFTGGNKKQITNIEGGINNFEYSPDGSKILYTKNVKMDKTPTEIYPDLPKAEVRIIDNLMYRHWDNWSDYAYSHIFVADLGNIPVKKGKDIMAGEAFDSPLSPYFDFSEIAWSNKGDKIAYTCKKLSGKEYAVSTNSDIYIYDLNTEKTENITTGMEGYDKYPVFSNDDSKIAFMSMETPGYESDKSRLFVYDFNTKEFDYLTKDFDQESAHYVWNKDNSEIYFISGINATYQLYKINVASKEVTQITKGWHNYTTFDIKSGVLFGAKMSMSMATEIFKINEADGKETQLTFTNKEIYDNIEMGKVEEHWVTTTDNKKMLVWTIKPPKFEEGKKYPAILYCQGGPQSAVSQFFSYRWNFQIMAANGYVVIAPNRRGLPSFGQEWNAQISGDYGGQNMKDYLTAVDEMKKEDYIDENNIGAVGASYGGFSVFWLAGHHEGRFKAFISHCGMFNLESQYAGTEEMFFVNHDLGGAYWEKDNPTAQKSYATSPHKFVQNWDTPILIITGARDFRIPYTESLQAFNAAQLLGVPSKLLYFPDETHFVLKPQNSILWQREFKGWLDKYLK